MTNRETKDERRKTKDKSESFTFHLSPFAFHLLLAIITLMGGVLRFYRLGHHSLWGDEAFSVVNAQRELGHVLRADLANPPLHMLMLHFWLKLGDSDTMVRLPSAVFGTATIPLLFWAVRPFFGDAAAILASLLLALSGFHLFYSQEGRMYGMLCFEAVLMLGCLLRAVRTGRAGWWLAYLMAGLAAAYTHFVAFVLLAGGFLFAFLSAKPPSRRKAVAWHLLLAALLLPAAAQIAMARHHKMVQPALNFKKGLGSLFLAPNDFLADYWLGLKGWSQSSSGLEAAVLALLLMSIALAILGLRSLARRSSQRFFFTCFLALPLLAHWLLTTLTAYARTKYVICALPVFDILLSVGVLGGSRRSLPMTVPFLTLFLWLNLTAVANHFFNPRYFPPDWRAAVQHVLKRSQPGDLVVVPDFHGDFVRRYGDGRLRCLSYRDFLRAEGKELSALSGGHFLWFIVPHDEHGLRSAQRQRLLRHGFRPVRRFRAANITVLCLSQP